MTTLATMKARIADELMRDDLTSQIALAISDSITHYQPHRFYFNESDQITFLTLSTGTIPYLYDIDAVYALIGGNEIRMHQITPEEWRILTLPETTGQPLNWVYFQEALRIYPVPDQVYRIRIMAHYKLLEPGSEDEENNRWMTDGEKLIRHYAKYLLFRDVIYDVERAAVCFASANDAAKNLNAITEKMSKSGYITATEF
jgi:hypothetical protein